MDASLERVDGDFDVAREWAAIARHEGIRLSLTASPVGVPVRPSWTTSFWSLTMSSWARRRRSPPAGECSSTPPASSSNRRQRLASRRYSKTATVSLADT
ncbi:hypothetical protein ACH35V_18970 [Actinomadura sp. 1N219]|uniref:hypothetical protein n=1 Tax=Actinomadura sp. 1N219 TaxID=3375152 RepID=UPI0037914767